MKRFASRRVVLAFAVALPLGLAASPGARAQEFDFERDFAAFAEQVVSRHGLDAARVRAVLADARYLERVIEAMRRPAERKPWHEYRRIFLTESRIEGGIVFWRDHAKTLERAYQVYGVPPQVVTAIIGVETLYGQRAGNIRVLDALATLGFRYPRRAKFFSRELEEFLVLAEEEGLDPLGVEGSYAGAMGIPQFIPSSYRAYAVDFDGDGVRDLVGNPVDAIGSVASYLARHGWQRDAPIATRASGAAPVLERYLETGLKPKVSAGELIEAGVTFDDDGLGERPVALLEYDVGAGDVEQWAGLDNFYAITRYNRSKLYAMAVYQLSEEIRVGRAGGG